LNDVLLTPKTNSDFTYMVHKTTIIALLHVCWYVYICETINFNCNLIHLFCLL